MAYFCKFVPRKAGAAPNKALVVHEDEVRRLPEFGRNAASRPRGEHDIVVIGDSQLVDDRGARLRLDQGQIFEELVQIRAAFIAIRGERQLGVLSGKVPGEEAARATARS